jgi:hypothetical protein
LDGSAQIPVEPQHSILVEVTQKALRLEKPETGERRAAREGDTLAGKRYVIASEVWVIFDDGYGIREHRLKEAWDDLAVEAHIFTQEGGNEELFT